jgi:hypothetical protein
LYDHTPGACRRIKVESYRFAMKLTDKQKRKHRRRAKLKQTLRRLRKKG